jgi:hypothetical protein
LGRFFGELSDWAVCCHWRVDFLFLM